MLCYMYVVGIMCFFVQCDCFFCHIVLFNIALKVCTMFLVCFSSVMSLFSEVCIGVVEI